MNILEDEEDDNFLEPGQVTGDIVPTAPINIEVPPSPSVTQPTQQIEEPQVPEEEDMVDISLEEPLDLEAPVSLGEPVDSVDWGDLDLLGARDNSLLVKLYQVYKDKTDADYIVPNSLEDLEQQEISVMESIERFTGQNLDESPQARNILVQRYEELEDIKNKRALLISEQDAETPSLGEIWDVVMDDPERFAFNLVQETINKPELIAAGLLGGWGFGVLGARVLTSMSVTGKAATAAKVSGSMVGAYSGGIATGAIDKVIESEAKGFGLDFSKAIEQSQMDGVIAAGGFVLGTGIAKGYRAANASKNKADFSDHLNNTELTDVTEIHTSVTKSLTPDEELDQALHPIAQESYVDPQGNVHLIDIVEQPSVTPSPEEVYELVVKASNKLPALEATKLRTKVKEDVLKLNEVSNVLEDLQALGSSEPKVLKRIETLTKEVADLTDSTTKGRKSLNAHSEALKANETLYGYDVPEEFRTPEFIEVLAPDGSKVLARKIDYRLTPEDNGVYIDGFNHTDFGTVTQGNGYKSVFEAVATGWYRSATASLRDISDVSPSARLLLYKLNPDTSNPKAGFWSLQEDIMRSQGKYNQNLGDIINEVQNKYVGKDAEAKIMLHMRGVEISQDPSIVKAATDLRALLNEHHEYVKSRGVVTEYMEDYLPRVWDKKALKTESGKQKYIERLMVDEQVTKDEATKSWKKIVMNKIGDDEMFTVSTKSGDIQPFGGRSRKKVLDKNVNEILSTNFFHDITSHLMMGARRAEMANTFGENGSKLDLLIKQIAKETDEAGIPFREGIDKERIQSLYKIYNGTYKPIHHEGVVLANNTAATIINLSKLGLATVTSLTEPLVMLARLNESSGIKPLLNTYVQTGKAGLRIAFKGLKEHESIVEARKMGLITDQAIAEMLDQSMGVGMTGTLAKINHKWFKATFLHQFTELTKGMAYGAAKDDIKTTISKLAMNPQDATRTRWLTEVGLDPKATVDWIKQGGNVTDPMYDQIKRAAVRMSTEIITNPNPANKPLYFSSPKMKLIAQLKTYPIVFGNTIIKRQWEEYVASAKEGRGSRKAANLAVTGTALTLGYMFTGLLKEEYRNLGSQGETLSVSRDKDEASKVVEAAIANLGPVGILAPVAGSINTRQFAARAVGTISPAAGAAVGIGMDPVKGLIDILPGSSLVPKELKKKMEKTIKESTSSSNKF